MSTMIIKHLICMLHIHSFPTGSASERIETEAVPCTITSMTIFDRLVEEGIVREHGSIIKCLDEYYEEFQIADELRKVSY